MTKVLSVALACGLLVSSARATEEGPPLLFGGAITPRKPPVLLDPRLPRGQMRDVRWAPLGRPALCSMRRPVCVDPAFGRPGLDALERAYEEHRYGLSLPGPRADEQRPLVFVRAEGPVGVMAQDMAGRGFDRALARCFGAELNMSAARRCVAESAVLARAPATAPWLRAGLGAAIALELGAAPEVQAGLRDAGQNPQLGILTSTQRVQSWQSPTAEAVPAFRSARFFKYLAERSPAALGHAGFLALLLGASHTQRGASRYDAEPDIMDVLSATVGFENGALARFMDDYARYSLVDTQQGWGAADAAHGLTEWVVEGASLPRTLALPRPIEPTGSTYVRLKLSAEQRHQTIAVQTRCEAPVSYVWSVMRWDDQRRPLMTLPIGYLERGTGYQARVEAMEGTAELTVVGTNLGGIDMAHPFDPDHGPHESHGCQVYLSVL